MKGKLGGITIDLNPLPRMADFSIISGREPLSKLKDSSHGHSEKLHFPKLRTDDGITTDVSLV
jgi:hypothetical protein